MRSRPDEEGLLRELEDFYRDVDEAYAATSCPATTECCRFGRTGREPYVTSIEVAMVARAVARRGGRTSVRPRPLHETHTELPVLKDERACALLSAEGRCTIYAARPFGCRTFFCERKTSLSEVKHREVLAFVARLKQIAEKHQPGADQGRPFSRVLSELNKPRSRTSKSSR